jgi:hypothetical protein
MPTVQTKAPGINGPESNEERLAPTANLTQHFAQWCTLWGGRDSNPRPRDYEIKTTPWRIWGNCG